MLHVTALLIIAGGLSPLTLHALPLLIRRGGPPVPVQARLGLLAALFLLFGGFRSCWPSSGTTPGGPGMDGPAA